MAELNFGLLTPPGSQSIGNAFVTGMDQGQEARARDLQMQQSTRKGQMDELTYKKALDTESRLNKYYANIAANGGPKTALEAENAMIGSGIPHIADMGAKAQLLRLTNESDLALFNAANPQPGAPAAAATAVAPMAPAVVPEPGSFGADVAERRAADPFAPPPRANMLDGAAPAAASANNLLAAVSGAARPNISEEVAAIEDQIDRNIRLGTPRAKAQVASLQTKLAALIKTTATGGSLFNSRGEVIATAPEKSPAPPSMVAEYTFAQTPAGGGFRGSFQDFVRERAAAARPPAQPRPEQPPVSVVDPDTGKPVLVSRDEAIARRMTPANAAEGLAPKEIQKREAAFPAATSAVNGFEKKSDDFIKDLIALRDDPGLDQITGPIYGRIGSVSRAGSRAQALYDKIVAKGGFQALQDLRDASKTGGALGNVSNQEGNQLKASFAAIDRRQAAEDVQAAINQVIAHIEGARTRTREAYDSTYSYKNAAGQAAPAGATGAGVDKSNPLLR